MLEDENNAVQTKLMWNYTVLFIAKCSWMLTILVKTIVNTIDNTLAIKYCRYQFINTNTFVPILFIVYYISSVYFFHGHLLIKLIERL